MSSSFYFILKLLEFYLNHYCMTLQRVWAFIVYGETDDHRSDEDEEEDEEEEEEEEEEEDDDEEEDNDTGVEERKTK